MDGGGTSVGRYVEECLRIKRKTTRASTAARYEELARIHLLPVFGGMDVRGFAGADLRRHVARMLEGADDSPALSRSTVRQAVVLLRNALDLAVEDGTLLANPVSGVSRQFRLCSRKRAIGEDERIYYIPPPDAAKLFEELRRVRNGRPRAAGLFLALHRAGLRLGEARALQWQDLDFSQGSRSIHVRRTFSKKWKIEPPKGGEARLVDMSQDLARTLYEAREKAPRMKPWVFLSNFGGPFDERNIENQWKRAVEFSGIAPCRIHDLRHTFAIEILRQGKSLVYVRDQLGHSDIQVTANYYGRYTRMRDLSAVDALDGQARAARAMLWQPLGAGSSAG